MSLPKLRPQPAVCAIIRFADGRYLLQHRDDLPQIFYPDHWGLFGGAIEPGEDELTALRRELDEELSLGDFEARPFFRYDFTFQFGSGTTAQRPMGRQVYEIDLPDARFDTLRLGEGQAMARVAPQDILALKLIPYDAFALAIHLQQERYEFA